jgi:hypothetical protein
VSDDTLAYEQQTEPASAAREGSFGNDTATTDRYRHKNEAEASATLQPLGGTATEAAGGVEADGASPAPDGGEPTAGDPAQLAPDGHVINFFLQWLTARWAEEFPGALLQLDSGDPEKRARWRTVYFPVERLEQATAWAAQRNRLGRNIYVGVNPRRSDLDQKKSANRQGGSRRALQLRRP